MRYLTEKQHAKLDRIDKDDPHAIAIGWLEEKDFAIGPIVRFSDVKKADVVVNRNGYSRKL